MKRLLPGAAALLLASTAPAQRDWTITAAAHADLWFHGLAVVGLQGFGPLPFYSAAYATETRAAKRAAGRFPTLLDSLAPELGAAFARDSAFEILHFVPLYFAAAEPAAMLDALAEVARGRPPPEPGARLVASVLRSASQRRALGSLVRALRAEWDGYFGAQWNARRADRERALAAATAEWRDLEGALGGFLRTRRLDAGRALASAAVGPEGRVFRGDPADPEDNQVVVWLPAGPDAGRIVVAALVRELCYPLVTATLERTLGGSDRVAAERVSSRAAVRCGALLLERHRPDLVAGYRAAFLGGVGESATDAATFERVFAVPPPLLAALRDELGVR